MLRSIPATVKRCSSAAEIGILLAVALLTGMIFSTESRAQGPGLTTISGTVYRADGSAASGTVLISWPSFQTATGDAVAAGTLSVTIGPLGAFTAQLAPNVGTAPAGTYYNVVFQLDDGTVRTEYWAVPATSPTTIAAVLTTPGNGLNNLAATQQYVDTQVATRAIDSTVVHLSGAETITGAKQFAVPPALPLPSGANDAANKGYVDAAVVNVGAGSYVSKAGDTMTGPLNLPSDPVAPNQASDRHYVDSGLAAKADLIQGIVPTGELGSGTANASTCLTGNSTWGACGGAPAGITFATTALNWTQTISSPLTAGAQTTVTLTPCPIGIDTTSGAGYQVLISEGGTTEAVSVLTTAGACTSGAASGTITFTPYFSHAAGYTLGSASSGIQETINVACGASVTNSWNSQCHVTIPSNGPWNGSARSYNTYNVYGTIFFHSGQSVLDGSGVSLNCLGRGPCLQIGDLKSSNDFANNTVLGLSFASPTNLSGNPSFAGVAVTQTQAQANTCSGATPNVMWTGSAFSCVAANTAGSCSTGVRVITTSSAHGFRPGDMVTALFTDDNAYWGDAIVANAPASTNYSYCHSGATKALQVTPGVAALAYSAVLDNSENTKFLSISYDFAGENGAFNNFFDLWDDENASIDHFNNNSIPLNRNANWTGSFVFSAGNQGALQQIAPVITLRDSNLTAGCSNGVTVYNSNGIYIENTVMQSTGPWQVYSANSTGNYQGAYLKNIYAESTLGCNPSGSSIYSPFPGLGIAGLIAGSTSGAGAFQIAGSGGTLGAFPTGGTGATPYTYYIVANDITAGTQTSPMQILNWSSTGSDSIPVKWPRVANGTDVITYDVIRMTTPVGVGAVYPNVTNCNGGSGGACGYVAQGLSQAVACSSGLVCSYTDTGSSATAGHSGTPANYPSQGTYNGNFLFWPGSIVTVNKSVTVDTEEGPVVAVGLNGNPVQVGNQCTVYGAASPGGYTTCLASNSSSLPNQTATILSDGAAAGGGMTLSKGRLNFATSAYAVIQPHHIITLIDSQPGLTRATSGYRPPASANDTWIGTDVSNSGVGLNQGQLAFGAPVAITNYIAQSGDGVHANWLERLSASLKEFNVPAKFDQNVTLSGLANGCLNVTSGVIGSTGSPCGSGGGGGVTSIFGRSGIVTAANGDYTVSQVTGAAADAAVVHNTGNETIAGAKTLSGNVTVNGNLILPQGYAFAPPVGGIGLDSAAGLPVVNIGGTTQQIALTSSNISGQAGTALALATTPTQCSGSFATGIAANGNANCTTANMIQLAETTPPSDPPNYGVFWFDSATHTPHAIDNNHVIQMGLNNLFNSDPGGDPLDNLEELNGSTPQNLRVYSNYVNNTAWTRMSLGSETVGTTNYNVLRSEDATSGNALSLGMHIGSSIKWFFSSDGTFKPNSDYSYDIGTDTGQAIRSIFAKTSFNMYSTGRQDFEFANDGASGTTLNSLAVYNSGASGVQTASTASTDGVVGIVSGGAGTSNKAVLTWAGLASCNFDAGNPTAGDYVVASTTQAGKCHDTGSTTRPSGVQVIGRIESGEVRVSLAPPSGGGAVGSVFGRTGAIVANTGDYSVSQVTGAAADAAVVHLAGAETISGSKTFSSDVTLNGNLNVAGTINQMGSGPTQWSGKEWTGTTATVPTGMDFSLGIGSDNTFKCQLASGASCMPASGGMVYPGAGVPSSTGTGWGTSYGTSGTGTTLALTASPVFTGSPTVPGYVANSTTVNGHALSGNVAVAPADLAAGAFVNGMTAATQSAGDNSAKLATTAYVRSEIQMAWSCPVAGTTSTVQYCNWTLPAAITITGFDLAASTGATGCTTYPTLQIWDGTANAEVGSYSIAFTSGTNFFPQVAGSANVASGHFLRLKITTAGAGCSTNAGGVVGTITYQMQN